jgi:Protein of unknown function (DUF2384)
MELAQMIMEAQASMANIKDRVQESNDRIDGQIMLEIAEKMIERTYANWPDEPLPIFKNRTPRQEMKTVAGLERVKGLLRTYEQNEARQAKSQERGLVSFQFLWDALGLTH